MKYCTKCGAQIDDEAVICPKCGCYASGRPEAKFDNDKTKNIMRKIAYILFIITYVALIMVSLITLGVIVFLTSANEIENIFFALPAFYLFLTLIMTIIFGKFRNAYNNNLEMSVLLKVAIFFCNPISSILLFVEGEI